MERKNGIIFDMDGVLVDAMPFHCKAIQTAAKQEVNIDVAERDVYLLEGMPGEDMVRELLQHKRYMRGRKKFFSKLMLQRPLMVPKNWSPVYAVKKH